MSSYNDSLKKLKSNKPHTESHKKQDIIKKRLNVMKISAQTAEATEAEKQTVKELLQIIENSDKEFSFSNTD